MCRLDYDFRTGDEGIDEIKTIYVLCSLGKLMSIRYEIPFQVPPVRPLGHLGLSKISLPALC